MIFAIDSLNTNHFQILNHNFSFLQLVNLYDVVLRYDRFLKLNNADGS